MRVYSDLATGMMSRSKSLAGFFKVVLLTRSPTLPSTSAAPSVDNLLKDIGYQELVDSHYTVPGERPTVQTSQATASGVTDILIGSDIALPNDVAPTYLSALAFYFNGSLTPTKALTSSVGTVSTPDTPDMTITGPVRVTFRAQIDSFGTGFPFMVAKEAVGAREFYIYGYAPGNNTMNFSAQATGGSTLDGNIVSPTPLGTPHTYGAEFAPGSATFTSIFDSVRTTVVLGDSFAPPNTASPVLIGSTVITSRIYWAQLEAINRAQLVFPGVSGTNAFVPHAANLQIIGAMTIMLDFDPADYDGIQVALARFTDALQDWQIYLNGTQLTFSELLADGGTYLTSNSTALPYTPGARVRVAVTRVVNGANVEARWFSSTDGTTWTPFGTMASAAGAPRATTSPIYFGDQQATAGWPFNGRIRRCTVANGVGASSTPGGTVVLDVSENNAGVMADATHFVATTGQTVTVNQAVGSTVVRPQPDTVTWRFDASDYPGTGTSYVDPRGQTWTLTNAGAITDVDLVVNPWLMITDETVGQIVYPGSTVTTVSQSPRKLWSYSQRGTSAPYAVDTFASGLIRSPGVRAWEPPRTQHVYLYPQKVNYVPNPSFEDVGRFGWRANGPITRVVGGVDSVNNNYGHVVGTRLEAVPSLLTSRFICLSAYVRGAATSPATWVKMGLCNWNSSWTQVEDVLSEQKLLTNTWTRHYFVSLVPDNLAGSGALFVTNGNFDVDLVMLEHGADLNDYFDGDSDTGILGDFSWQGVTHQSLSFWYNNRWLVGARLFGAYQAGLVEQSGLVYDWVPAGTAIHTHWDVLTPNDTGQPMVDFGSHSI